MAALGSYEPTLLRVYEGDAGPCSEPLEFLSTLFPGESRPLLLPTPDIGASLPKRLLSFGPEPFELGQSGPYDRSYIGILPIKHYTSQQTPAQLADLLRL